MYIKEIYIKNYGKFQQAKIELNKMSILIARNDSGKTTVFKLISSVFNTVYESKDKYLNFISISNLNTDTLAMYKDKVIREDYLLENVINEFPEINIIVKFEIEESKDRTILRHFECGDQFELCVNFKLAKNYSELCDEVDLSNMNNVEFLEFLLNDEFFETTYKNLKGINVKKHVNQIGTRYLTTSRGLKNGRIQFQAMEESFQSTKLEKYKIASQYKEFLGKLSEEYGRSNPFNSDNIIIPENMKDINIIPEQLNSSFYFNRYIPLNRGNSINQDGDGFKSLFEILLYIKLLEESVNRFALLMIEEPELHLCNDNLYIIKQNLENLMHNNKYQTLVTTHSNQIIDKLDFQNVVVETSKGFEKINSLLSPDELQYLSLNPNMDLYTFLISTNVILVEGITEEIYIKALLKYRKLDLNANVISFHKGYINILTIWDKLFNGTNKKIVCIRDFDDQPNAQLNHEEKNSENIKCVTTTEYTFEPEFIKTGNNRQVLKQLNEVSDFEIVNKFINGEVSQKSELAYRLAEMISIDKDESLEIPKYLTECFDFLKGEDD